MVVTTGLVTHLEPNSRCPKSKTTPWIADLPLLPITILHPRHFRFFVMSSKGIAMYAHYCEYDDVHNACELLHENMPHMRAIQDAPLFRQPSLCTTLFGRAERLHDTFRCLRLRCHRAGVKIR